MKPNPGHLPADAVGKRVRVLLANGDLAKTSWPANGPQGCRWSKLGHPYDIKFYEVIA